MAEARITVDMTGFPEVKAAIAELVDIVKAYKDYYGTSPAQVRHLQTCKQCCDGNGCSCDGSDRCSDYPTE